MFKTKILLSFLFFFIFTSFTYGQVKIKFKIDDQIITDFDIIQEKNYLIFLRPELKKLSNKEMLKISENSLIREIIKKKELLLIYKNVEKTMFIDELKKNLMKYKNVKNEQELKNLLNANNIDYTKVIEKIKYEALWNELILRRYNSLVKINREHLKEKLIIKISNEKKYEYNLSEILFEIENKNEFQKKYDLIKKYIKLNSFKSAALKYSISNSANKGGEIGWIKETVLSDKLLSILNKTEKNSISKPIKYPNGYLLLKINEKREIKRSLNIDQELEEFIKFEKNRQLNQFSLLLYKKLKQNTVINEY